MMYINYPYKKFVPKYKFLEYIFAFVFILPYTEIGAVRKAFSYSTQTIYLHSSQFLMLAITLILLIASVIKGSNKVRSIIFKKITRTVIIFSAIELLVSMIGSVNKNIWVSLSQLSWVIIPLLYATSIIYFIMSYELSFSNVGRIGLFYFILYAIFCIVYNILHFGLQIRGAALSDRMTSTGGGAVIFGYTIALMACYLLYKKYRIKKIFGFGGIIIFTMSAIATGSRGAIWPVILIFFMYFISHKKSIYRIISICLLIILIITINPFRLIGELVPRVLAISDNSRISTWRNSLLAFSQQSFFEIIFGTGLGNFYPYQYWFLSPNKWTEFISYNLFFYNGLLLLVQPHNVLIYLLLETGLVGVSLYIYMFIIAAKEINRQTVHNIIYKKLLLFLIFVLNCFDAIFIVSPGPAGLWWIMYYFAIYDGVDEQVNLLQERN